MENIFSKDPIKVERPPIQPFIAAEEEKPYVKSGESLQQLAERESKTIFVGNVSTETDKKVMANIFKQFGTLDKMWVRSVPVEQETAMSRKAKIILKKHSSNCNSKNFYILFKDKLAAERALVANATIVEGRHLHVTPASHIARDFKSTVFVGNLPFSCDEEELWTLFQNCGPIEYVRIVRDRRTLQGQGFAYVKFDNSTAVSAALELNGQQFSGRELRVFKAKKKFLKEKSDTEKKSETRPLNEEFRETSHALSKTVNPKREVYDEAKLNNVFKHQAVVPTTRYRKTLKNIKKKATGDTFNKQIKLKADALKRLNKEYFEKDNLLKIRREKLKMKKNISRINSRRMMKPQKNFQ